MSRRDTESDDVLPAGQAARQVDLMRQLYRTPRAELTCGDCRGKGNNFDDAGRLQLCGTCQGRGRVDR